MTIIRKKINSSDYSKTLTFIVIKEIEELEKYVLQWNNILFNSIQKNPMLSYAWVSSYLEHRLNKNETWYIILAKREQKLLGILPIIVTPNSIAGLNRPILRVPNDTHTMGGDILISRDEPEELLSLLIHTAENITPKRYLLKLSRVVENSPSITSNLTKKSSYIFKKNVGIGYYYPVDGNFNTYHSSLSKNFRGNLRRAENKLKKTHKLKTVIIEGNDANADFLSNFMPVEASGWKGHTGSAINQSHELIDFYTTLTKRLSDSEMLRWECLYADDQLIAVNLSVRFAKTVVIWKLGYDENLRKYSPGSILFISVLEHAFLDSSIKEFNLLSDTPWQTNWKPKQREYYDIYFYPNKPISILFGYFPNQLKANIRKYPSLMNILKKITN